MTKILTKKQAAQYLGISERTIDSYRERGIIPSHVIGGKLVRFFEDELESWVRNCDVTSTTANNSKEKSQI